MYAPYARTSFLDRREHGGRPLGWRSGLPPSAIQGHLLGQDDSRRPSTKTATATTTATATDDVDGGMHVTATEGAERIRYATVWANHDRLQTRPSRLEGGQQRGIFVRADRQQLPLPPWLALSGGEHLHVHADGSAHMILSLADAATAVERGWAESAAASTTATGSSVVLPLGYVAVHTPRNDTELAEWKRLAMASVRYYTHPCHGMEIRRPERF